MASEKHVQIVDARSAGRQLIFAEIRKHSPIARVDIARMTGLSPATVTSITSELISANLIKEVATDLSGATSKRGRPRVDLAINDKAHIVVGVKISDRSATLTIMDFAGDRIASFEHLASKRAYQISELLLFIDEALNHGLDQLSLRQKDLSSIGLGIAGIIDAQNGIVIWSPILAGNQLNLRQRLSDWFGVPAFIDNDANLVALAERHEGVAQTTRNFAVVTVEQGVGIGIVINDKIYRGYRGSGSELGHTKVQLDGALCRCGQRGCIEAYVGDYALLREATTTMGEIKGKTVQDKMLTLLAEAENGHIIAQSIVQHGGRVLAMGIANIINILAPELIILTGERIQKNTVFSDAILDDIKQFSMQQDGTAPHVIIHEWDNKMWSFGAAIFALNGIAALRLAEL